MISLKIILVIIIIILIILILLISDEIIRHQGGTIVPIKNFYTSTLFPLSLYTIWCKSNTEGSDEPFPKLKDHFPRHHILKDNWKTIRDEALEIYNSGKASKIKNDLFFETIADNGWKKFYICWYGPIGEDAMKLCPKTCKLIEKLPEIKLAMFSILEPGSKIKPHVGPFKGAKRYHLGLSCPKGAKITVDGINYSWSNGEDVLIDDTYIHEVVNDSDEVRVILFCDVVNTMSSESAQRINNKICDLLGPLTTRANSKNEKIVSQ